MSFTDPKGIKNHRTGTPAYQAPEILQSEAWDGIGEEPAPYDKSIDVWATTVTLELHSEIHKYLQKLILQTPLVSGFSDGSKR